MFANVVVCPKSQVNARSTTKIATLSLAAGRVTAGAAHATGLVAAVSKNPSGDRASPIRSAARIFGGAGTLNVSGTSVIDSKFHAMACEATLMLTSHADTTTSARPHERMDNGTGGRPRREGTSSTMADRENAPKPAKTANN